MEKLLLALNCIILSIGSCGGPLISRVYFTHGGQLVWLSSTLQTGGWPIILIPLIVAYIRRRKTEGSTTKIFFMKPFLFTAFTIIGCIVGLNNYLYAYGNSKLPVSTFSLVYASNLAFTAVFAFLLVKHKFTAYSINAVFLMTVGAVVLATHSGSDRPEGESNMEYVFGFVMTIAAATLCGLTWPMVELAYMKAKQSNTYTLVMEVQIVMCFFSSIFCFLGMLVNNELKAISSEAREFELGYTNYYVIIVSSAIIWQCNLLGLIGVTFYTSSMVACIIGAALLPVTEILAVIIFHENFQAEKGISMVLSLWGFLSYFYGEIKHRRVENSTLSVDYDRNSLGSTMPLLIQA